MLESAPVSVTKADTTVVSQIKDVRESDSKGQPVNLNKSFTVEGVATVDTPNSWNTKAELLYSR